LTVRTLSDGEPHFQGHLSPFVQFSSYTWSSVPRGFGAGRAGRILIFLCI
jgi:hypothetical protein